MSQPWGRTGTYVSHQGDSECEPYNEAENEQEHHPSGRTEIRFNILSDAENSKCTIYSWNLAKQPMQRATSQALQMILVLFST